MIEDGVRTLPGATLSPYLARIRAGAVVDRAGTRRARNKLMTMAVLCVAALALGACASNPTNAQIGTGVGAVVGGVVGDAVIGGAVGTIGGAAAGAFIGHEIGEGNDQPPRRNRR